MGQTDKLQLEVWRLPAICTHKACRQEYFKTGGAVDETVHLSGSIPL